MSGTIPYSLPITAGNGASFPLLNITQPTFPSDANYTATQSDLASILHIVGSGVSLTAQRNIVYPLIKGLAFLVGNETTGGQSIQVIGATGTGIVIPTASASWVWCDGTNWNRGNQVAAPGGTTPTGTGFAHVTGGVLDSAAIAVNLGTSEVTGTLPSTNGGTGLTAVGTTDQFIGTPDGTTIAFITITQDMIAPGFSVALSGGGTATFVTGATWTPSGFTAAPAPNAGGISSPTITDNQGHSGVSIVGGNPISAPVGTYTLTAPGTVTIFVTETKAGVTKNSNTLTSTWADRTFQGVGGAGATAATASSTNAALTGGSSGGTTLTGTAATPNAHGQTFTVSPASQKIYDMVLHTGSPYTYSYPPGLPLGMGPGGNGVPTTITFVNENGVSESWDLYESTNLLSGTYVITRT
jgi:hypothetical protein